MEKAGVDTLVVLGDSTRESPNLLYLVGAWLPRGGIYVKRVGQKPLLIVGEVDLEAAKRGKVGNVKTFDELGYSELVAKMDPTKARAAVVESVLRELGAKKVLISGKVEAQVAISLAGYLRRRGFRVATKIGVVERARMTKDSEEVEKIAEAGRATERAISEAIEVLRDASNREGKLSVEGRELTVGDLKQVIISCLAREGLKPIDEPIVAVGEASHDPHYPGYSEEVVRANKPIIIDVFPRRLDGYCFDCTRTVVVGRADKRLRELFEDVLEAQQIAMDMAREGVRASKVARKVCEFFEKRGHRTPLTKGAEPLREGFVHSVGHGVGLTIEEPPYISTVSKNVLRSGMVATIEPGLYYRGVGGVRLEDVVVVEKGGVRNLSKLEKALEL